MTVGVDFSSKIVEVDGNQLQLQVWDTVNIGSRSLVRMFTNQSQVTSTAEQLLFF